MKCWRSPAIATKSSSLNFPQVSIIRPHTGVQLLLIWSQFMLCFPEWLASCRFSYVVFTKRPPHLMTGGFVFHAFPLGLHSSA